MAKVLKQHDFSLGRGRYPWKKWLDGQVWFVPRKEYAPTPSENFRVTIVQAALRRKLRVQTHVKADGSGLVLQAQGRRA
jgi:hypothetical protein